MAYLDFQPNAEGGFLEYKKQPNSFAWSEKTLRLFPVPFSAADGISWKGQSFSTNVAADETLNAKLQSLAEELVNPQVMACSYSATALPDGWTGTDPYERASLHRQYFGLIREPGKANQGGKKQPKSLSTSS